MEADQQANPYRSPTVEEEPAALNPKLVEFDRRRIVTPPVAVLPERCFYCNEPGITSRVVRRLFWVSFSGIFSVRVRYFLCECHRAELARMRWTSNLTSTGLVVFFLTLYFGLWSIPQVFVDYSLWLVFASLLHAVVTYALRSIQKRVVKPTLPQIVRGNQQGVHIANAGKPFLDSLAGGEEGFRVE